MIKKTLITTVVLLFIWSIVIKLLPADLDTQQHQWSDNMVRAQDYLYEDFKGDFNVILGSSLANLLAFDLLPDNTRNLAFNGLGVIDGLEVMVKAEQKPKVVFIETNMILRYPNKNFIEALFSPFSDQTKKRLAAVRERNQPVGVLKGLIKGAIGEKTTSEETDTVINKAALKRNRLKFTTKPDKGELYIIMFLIKEKLAALKESGVKIVFFEMPVHPDLCEEVLPLTIRETLAKEFPDNVYLKRPDCGAYQTTDGIHLDPKSALRYTSLLNKEMLSQ